MKLEIPSPDGPKKDETELSDELWIAVMICVVMLFFGWFFLIVPQTNEEPDPLSYIEDVEEREEYRDRLRFEEMLEEGRYFVENWDLQERARALSVGPREITEEICTHRLEAIKEGSLPIDEREALLGVVKRRSNDAPWTCLLRVYLREELPDGELKGELDEFWDEVEELDEGSRIMAGVMADFRTSRDRPEVDRFYRWLRRCAIAFNYGAASQCQRLARQLAPKLGSDMLELVLIHLDDDRLTAEELLDSADALVELSSHGQPESWYIEETRTLPDYDVDFRLGALFVLCRLVNSPSRGVRTDVTKRLGRVASISGRPDNPYMVYRWREACKMAYGDTADPHGAAPMLSVFSGEEPTVDYSMNGLYRDGYCEEDEERPVWFCGADQWNVSSTRVGSVLGEFFARTAYVEWFELDELAELMPILTE